MDQFSIFNEIEIIPNSLTDEENIPQRISFNNKYYFQL